MINIISKSTNPKIREKDMAEFIMPSDRIWDYNLVLDIESKINRPNWFTIAGLISRYIKNARDSYINNLQEATVFYSISALEHFLKLKYIEYLWSINQLNLIDKFLKDADLGNFTSYCKNKKKRIDLNEIKLSEFQESIDNLNNARNGLFHYNYEKLEKSIKNDYGTNLDFLGWNIDYSADCDDKFVLNVYKEVCKILDCGFKLRYKKK